MVRVSSAASLPHQQFAGLERPGPGTVPGPGLGREATTLETAVTITVPSTGGGLINRTGVSRRPRLKQGTNLITIHARGIVDVT